MHAEFKARGAEVFGVSPDPVERHASFRDKLDLPFRLLADTEKEVAKKYDVWKEKNRFGVKSMGVQRSTFIIDEEGRLEECMYGVSAKGHAEDVLACVKPADNA